MPQTQPMLDLQQVTVQLHDEFTVLSHKCVEHCVSDTYRRAKHLGFRATSDLVARVAREHLQAMIHSHPPSNPAHLLLGVGQKPS